MAQVEPMDVENDFEDKENLLQVNNILSRTSCTEKGYEEMDVSEISMKLRYSITPCSSPMSKSFTGNCDSKFYDTTEAGINDSFVNGNISLTHSLNSTLTKVDNKGSKLCQAQHRATDVLNDVNRNPLCQRSLDSNHVDPNITITFNDNLDESFSLPSTSSSTPQTPEAITPTKEMPKDGGSPIMRGLKSVFSMFRSSQSPIAAPEVSINQTNNIRELSYSEERLEPLPTSVSTPISNLKTKESSSKRISPLKESLVFNEDLEKELLWKDDSTIIFKDEKIPIHKLLLQPPHAERVEMLQNKCIQKENDSSVMFMDKSQKGPGFSDKITTDIDSSLASNNTEIIGIVESDSEFVDCETTFTKNDLDNTESQKYGKSESVPIPKKLIEDENDLECQKLNLTSSIISSSINSVHDFERVTPKNVLLEKTVSIDYGQCTEVSIITNNTKLSESITIQEQTNQITISDNDNEEIKSDNLNHNASATTKCDSFISPRQDILDVASNQDKKLYEINNYTPAVLSPTCANSLFNSEIGIAEQITNKCEYDNTFTTNRVIDGEYNKCLSQMISDELKTTADLTIDNIESDRNIEKTIVNLPSNENLKSENISDKLIINEQVLHKDLSSETALNNCSETSAIATHLFDKETKIEQTYKEDISLPNKDSKMDLTRNEDLQANIKENKILKNELDTFEDNFEKMFIAVSPTLSLNNINICAPMDIPLPCDNELEQEVPIEIKNIKKENVNNVTFLTDETVPLNIESDGCNVTIPPSDITLLDNYILRKEDIRNENVSFEINKQELVIEKNIACIQSNDTFKINEDCSVDNLDFNDYLHMETESDAANITINEESVKCVPNEQKMCLSNVTLKQLNKANQNCFDDNMALHMDAENDNTDKNCIQMSNLFKTNMDVMTVNKENNSEILENLNKPDHIDDILSNISRVQDSSVNEIVSKQNILDGGLTIEEDEIIISTSSSPYVSVTEFGLIEHDTSILEENNTNQINKFAPSPPISPKPIKKGCDINFDDIDDPFKTKTLIRSSPTPETPTNKSLPFVDQFKNTNDKKQSCFKNKRKSHPDKRIKKSTQNFNSNFDGLLDEQKKYVNNKSKEDISTDFKFEDVESTHGPIIHNTEIQVVDINKRIENFSDVSSILKDDCIPITLQEDFVIEQEHFPPLSNQMAIDTKNNSTPIELEFTNAISEIENKGTLSEAENKYILLEPMDLLKSESNNNFDLDEEIEKSMNFPNQLIGVELFEQKAQELLQNPELMNQRIVTPKIDGSDENNEKSNEFKLAETLENTNQVKDQELKEFSSNDKIEIFFPRTPDEDYSVPEVLTEDEDTVEGPFLEANDSSNTVNYKEDESDKDEMVQCDSTSTSAPTNDENPDSDELFIDAEAFEFLLNQNKSNVIADSGKESLFLKFDPLFAKRISSDGILAALSKIQKIQNSPKRTPKLASEENVQIETPMPGPSHIDSSYLGMDNLEVLSHKPMMVVNPAINPVVTPRKITPKINRRSLTFTSPAIAVIDKLLSLNGNDSVIDQNTYQYGREHNETDIAIMQLRELLAEKEINVHNLRCESKDLKDRLANLESAMKNLETETGERLRKINNLNERLAEKTKINKSMAVVVEEYERTIASLISDIQIEKKHNNAERIKLVKERDEQTAHLSSMEVSFSDLHSKYEKSKQIILSMKANEDKYKKSLQEFDESLVKMQSNYEFLKQHATSKLNHANQELEKINKAHESEVLKLNALIKRKELHITSLEETLAQKTKANEELTSICDELINKVG